MLGHSPYASIGRRRYRHPSDLSEDQRLRSWLCLVRGQGQDHHLALFVLLPSREIADRPQLALLVHREQVHIQD